MQPRFERRTVNSARALVAQARFRAGYDFLRLRADVGEVESELADWWEDFHLGDDDEREALLQDVKARQASAPRQRALAPGATPTAGTSVGKTAGTTTSAAPGGRDKSHHDDLNTDDTDDADEAEQPVAETAPRKRRRRRRRAAGGAASTPE